jgi:hypothetical protein
MSKNARLLADAERRAVVLADRAKLAADKAKLAAERAAKAAANAEWWAAQVKDRGCINRDPKHLETYTAAECAAHE